MKEAKFIEKLRGLNPCEEGLKYAESFGSLQKAWDACERGDWMLWLLGKLSGPPESASRKELVLIACKCARTALKYVEKSEKRPLKAIQTAEKWAKEAATIEEVREASTASYSAYAAYSVYAAYSAYAASSAASVASSAVYAAYAASVASSAASAASSVASYAAIQKKCADIVRKMHAKAPRLMTKKDEEAMK